MLNTFTISCHSGALEWMAPEAQGQERLQGTCLAEAAKHVKGSTPVQAFWLPVWKQGCRALLSACVMEAFKVGIINASTSDTWHAEHPTQCPRCGHMLIHQ